MGEKIQSFMAQHKINIYFWPRLLLIYDLEPISLPSSAISVPTRGTANAFLSGTYTAFLQAFMGT